MLLRRFILKVKKIYSGFFPQNSSIHFCHVLLQLYTTPFPLPSTLLKINLVDWMREIGDNEEFWFKRHLKIIHFHFSQINLYHLIALPLFPRLSFDRLLTPPFRRWSIYSHHRAVNFLTIYKKEGLKEKIREVHIDSGSSCLLNPKVLFCMFILLSFSYDVSLLIRFWFRLIDDYSMSFEFCQIMNLVHNGIY